MDERLLSAPRSDVGLVDVNALFALPSAVLALVDLDNATLVRVSDALAALLGTDPAECRGKPWRDLVGASEATDLQALPPVSTSVPVRRRFLRKNGTLLPVEWQTVALVGAGRPSLVIGAVRPEASGSAEWLPLLDGHGRRIVSALLDTAPVAVYLTDANGGLLFESADYSQHTGLPASAWWPDDLERVVHPLDVKAVSEAWAHARDHGTPLEQELRLRGLDGRYRWFLHRVVPVKGLGPSGVSGWVGTSTDIDSQKQVETSLRQQQAWFQSVANGLPVVIWVTLPDGTLEFLNRRWFEVTGQKELETLGTGWTRAIHPEDRERVRASFARSVEQGAVFDSEYRLRRADGEYVWVLDRGGPLYGLDGKVRARAGVLLEVDDRRRTATALAEARALLDAIFESAPVGIGFWDRDLRFQRLNEKLAEYNGLPADAHIGRTPAELLPGIADVQRLMDRWREMIASGAPMINVEVTGETFAVPGRQRSWEETFFPVRLGGQTVGLAAVVQETTERRIAQRALAASEARFRHLTEAAPVMAWTADAEGRLTYASPSMLAFAGLEALPQPPAVTVADVVAPDDPGRLHDAWSAPAHDGAPFEYEGRARDRRSGQDCWLLTRAVPVNGESGEIVEWVGASVDLTETRRATEALEEADRNKDEFLAMLAHELRNPLGPIRNAASLLRLPNPDGSLHQAARDMIDRQVTHIVRLVDDLLDISRLSRGRIALKSTRVDLVTVVRDTLADYRPLLVGAGLAVHEDLPGGPLWLRADSTRLAQIVGNLLHNARKFTPAGGSVHLSVSTAQAGATAVVRVRDTGVGIEPELLPYVFDPFRQGRQGLDRGRGGLGLGLSLVRGLAALHGGTVAVRSEGANRGAEFTVTLPLSGVETDATPPARLTAPTGRSRVLVVEDNPDSAESLRLLLTFAGHEVRVAETGASGLGIAQAYRPDVIICDVGLPGGLSGYDLARAIREDDRLRHCRLIALTGYGREEDLAESSRAGFDVHLTKPVEYERLAAMLARPQTDDAG